MIEINPQTLPAVTREDNIMINLTNSM